MKHISELQKTLSDFLNWHKSRANCLAQILQALFHVRTVNLTQIASAFKTESKEESAYRRVCRFFTGFSFDLSSIVPVVLRMFLLKDKYLLILDRTNWKWGKTPINILMLSIAYKGISVPLLWVVLDLEGNSCADDRIAIFSRVLKNFGIDKIEAIIADREFVGQKWFGYLIENNIPFVIRIKQGSRVGGLQEGCIVPLSILCKGLGRKKILNQLVTIGKYQLYVSIQKKKGAKEPMVVASNFKFDDALKIYRRRWEIETMFGCLKTRGFRMEDTHITDPDKIERLLFVLAIAFCWAYRIGDINAIKKPIPVKTHGRKSKSLFREGVDLIRRTIFSGKMLRKFRKYLSHFTSSEPRCYAL